MENLDVGSNICLLCNGNIYSIVLHIPTYKNPIKDNYIQKKGLQLTPPSLPRATSGFFVFIHISAHLRIFRMPKLTTVILVPAEKIVGRY